MSLELIAQYPASFRTECREVALQLNQGLIALPEACHRLINLDTKYQNKLNSWISLVNGDARRGDPDASTRGISEAVELTRVELKRVARKVLPA